METKWQLLQGDLFEHHDIAAQIRLAPIEALMEILQGIGMDMKNAKREWHQIAGIIKRGRIVGHYKTFEEFLDAERELYARAAELMSSGMNFEQALTGVLSECADKRTIVNSIIEEIGNQQWLRDQ